MRYWNTLSPARKHKSSRRLKNWAHLPVRWSLNLKGRATARYIHIGSRNCNGGIMSDIRLKLDPEKLQEAVKRVVEEVKGASLDIRGLRGLTGAWALVPRVIERVEKLALELGMLGEDKKSAAVEAILLLVPDRWIPDLLLRPLIGCAIEQALPLLRKRLNG